MICSECWASAPGGKQARCPRCGATMTGAPPSFRGLFRTYPWLGALLGLSFCLTVWAFTRRAPAPPPEVILPAVEPVTEAPAAPAEEVESAPVFPPVPPPSGVEAPAAPAAVKPSSEKVEPLAPTGNGSWSGGERPVPPNR